MYMNAFIKDINFLQRDLYKPIDISMKYKYTYWFYHYVVNVDGILICLFVLEKNYTNI